MDFERATLKAIFYDYPIESAIKAIEEAQKFGGKDDFMDILPQLVRWREQAFTTTEARMMKNLAQSQWLVAPKAFRNSNIPYIYCPLLLVEHIAKCVLREDIHSHNNPIVHFDDLFRWKDATLYVGEDLLTIAYVAERDSKQFPTEDSLFLWADTLNHDEPMLNRVLDKGISDVHAHYNATADVFHINWIALMNDLSKRNNIAHKVKQYQDVMFTTVDTESIIPFNRLCIAAAYLRVKFYEKYVLKQNVDITEFNGVIDILKSDFAAISIKRDLQAEIGVLRRSSLHTPDGHSLDYAILDCSKTRDNQDSIFLLYQGERELMYQYMLLYYGLNKEAWRLAPYFYMYLLIKTRVRKEFVQINQLKGFENFQTYQDRKSSCLDDNDIWSQQYGKYVVQSTLCTNKTDFLEARITPTSLNTIKEDFGGSVFSKNKVLPNVSDRLTFVAHFIKADYTTKNKKRDQYISNREGSPKFADYRGKLKAWINDILNVYIAQQKYESWDKRSNLPKLVGIDAASTEMFCRPEVFGHVYRFAKKKGMPQRTFHVGEDFFDIIDGLRAIDEAILFLDLDSNCRIGHALAVGVDTKEYYKERNYRAIMPRQYLLDNCVWVLMRAAQHNITVSNALETSLTKLAKKLYNEIGYAEPFDIYVYWNSMLLRSDEPELSTSCRGDVLLSDWDKTSLSDNREISIAREDDVAVRLCHLYNYSQIIKTKGDEEIEDDLPEGIEIVVMKLQKVVQRTLSRKNIAIECNPTSNLKIGYFDRYDQHPLLTTFDPVEKNGDCSYPLVNASVNTDDRGVFATSAYMELSLIALALQKENINCSTENEGKNYSPRIIEDYINRIRENGHTQRFKFVGKHE